MANPSIKVELGFDETAPGNWFTLDDATKGLLDGSYTLAGGFYQDVSAYAMTFSLGRGKSRELDRYQAGHVTVVFNNRSRYFDPTFVSSPFYGQIVPRRNIRITVKDVVQFTGIVDDWDLTFSTDGQATAVCNAYDNLSALSQQKLTAATYPSEYSGVRVKRVLDSAGVLYDPLARTIDAGQMLLATETVDNTVDALGYLQEIELSEDGAFFVDKNAKATFYDATRTTGSGAIVTLADDNTGVGYQSMNIIYGSELLYNSVTVTRQGGTPQVAVDTVSAQTYGTRAISETTLHAGDDQAARLAQWLVAQYAQPEFRFEAVDISMGDSTDDEQAAILGLELGGKCLIKYTPVGVPPAISKYAQIIGIEHKADPNQHIVTLRFKTVDYQLLILDDAVFGLLDYYYLGF